MGSGIYSKFWGPDLELLKYGCIYMDPPWDFKTYSADGGNRAPKYNTMSMQEIYDMRVADLAATNCLLAMWVTDPFLEFGFECLDSWGFKYSTVGFYWAKTGKHLPDLIERDNLQTSFPIGTGHWTRANPEICLFATRGSPKRLSASIRKLVVAPRREHSRKPDRVRDDLKKLVGGPYVELFARQKIEGWDVWGNQTDHFEVDDG